MDVRETWLSNQCSLPTSLFLYFLKWERMLKTHT